MAGGRVFINYRRDDSRADAGRIYDRLSMRYPDRVFRDVGSLEPGVEWREAIEKVLSASDACVVVIGKNWLNMADASGRRRLDDPRDTVRMEVLAALRNKMRVIPVLVGGATMPAEEELPEDLQALARRNALQISEQDWDEDMSKLGRALDQVLGLPAAATEPAHGRAEIHAQVSFFHGRFAFAFTGVLALSLIVAALVSYNHGHETSSPPLTASNSGAPPSAIATPSQSAPDSASPASAAVSRVVKVPPRTASRADTANRSAASTTVESARVPTPANPSVESAPTRTAAVAPPLINASNLTGSWAVEFTSPGQHLVETGALYSDGSFLVINQGNFAALGRWRLDSAKRQIDILNGVNYLNFGVHFGCALAARDSQGNDFRGPCEDAQRNSWTVALSRWQKTPVGESRPVIPGLDLSSLSLAQSIVFARELASQPCYCGCGLNLLACRRSRTEQCMLSLSIARQRLQQFVYSPRQ